MQRNAEVGLFTKPSSFAGHKMPVMQGMIDDIPLDIHYRHLFPDNIAVQPSVGYIPDKDGPHEPGAFLIKDHFAVSRFRGMPVYLEIVVFCVNHAH